MSAYLIVSRMNGLVLDVERSGTCPGTRVQMWPRHGSDNQLWYDDPATGTIRTALNGFCLDIECDGALRIMPYQPGDQNQQWYRDLQCGYIRNRINCNVVLLICSAICQPCATIVSGCASGAIHQLWNFEMSCRPICVPCGPIVPPCRPSPCPSPQPLPCPQQPQPCQPCIPPPVCPPCNPCQPPRREFYIISVTCCLVVEIQCPTMCGSAVVMGTKSCQPVKHELWYLDQQGYIRSAFNDYALDAAAMSKVVLKPFNGCVTQQWIIECQSIKNRCTCQELTMMNDNMTICSYNSHNGCGQKWRIEYVS